MFSTLILSQSTGLNPNDSHGWLIRFGIWFVVGVIAGSVAGMIIDKSEEGIISEAIVAICGSWGAGFLFSLIPMQSDLSLAFSIVVAAVGAAGAMLLYRMTMGGGGRTT